MLSSTLVFAAFLSSVNAHGAFINAQGETGSPASVGFGVDLGLARNCTGISPCQQDTGIIRDAEIAANVVNECGRTEIAGNIDVGASTEDALANNKVTSVVKGGSVAITVHQVNADGAGPYSCDLDETSNAGIISKNLTVTNNVPGVNGLSQAKFEDFTFNVAMPADLACTGGSTGNICTVRCRNNAVAGPFGGCIAVQQTDITATANSANKITTASSQKAVDAQVAVDIANLPGAVAANTAQGSVDGVAQKAAADALNGNPSVTSKAAAVQTVSVDNSGNAAAAAATTTSAAKAAKTAATKANKNKNNNKRGTVLKWAKRASI